jgi:hypothetical protein
MLNLQGLWNKSCRMLAFNSGYLISNFKPNKDIPQ